MKIQTFLNGQLVEESEVESYIPPNISGFNTQMLFSESYMKLISNVQNNDAKTRLELLSVRLELKPQITLGDLEIYKLIWDNLIASIPQGILVEADGGNFNQVAESNNMPFRFEEDFKLKILPVFE
ncbi:hypothetical protein [Nostoc sp. WHI]|uniref:hypothetical protein n=1 Tax=Nostoc sp. WHI TaxID=2650611 RepID=UPI0018C690B6|nr:hypothetical protein [Nostoc sp. WHI]MBG1265364.1 hypothetical protein [Nostoc sp. WHI]MBG1267739.1 hypothetical protein [Nostoc sp. WHI]